MSEERICDTVSRYSLSLTSNLSETRHSLMTQTRSSRIGLEVRGAMADKGRKQRDVATLLDLSQPAVSRRLRGVVPFSAEELAAVATYLDVPLETLLPTVAA